MIVNVKLNLDAVRKQVGALTGVVRNVRMLARAVADWMLAVARDAFPKEKSPEGVPWPRLSPRYAEIKARRYPGRGMLRASGALQRTLFSGVEGQRKSFVEASVPYASVHQDGYFGTARIAAHGRHIGSRDVFETVEDPIQGSDFGDLTRSRRRRRQLSSGFATVAGHLRSIHILPRPYLPGPALTEKEGTAIVEEFLVDAIRKSER